MSEVKRYHRSINLEGVTKVYEVVPASDYDTALSQLAALREELAESDAVVARVSELLAGVAVAVRGPELALRRRSYHDLPERVVDLQQRLADAERRNAAVPSISAEQYVGLNDFYLSVCCDSGHSMDKPMVSSLCEVGALESCGFGKHRLTKFGEYLLALTKPEEAK